MFGLSWKLLGGAGLLLALSLAWGFRVDHLRAGWKQRFEVIERQADTVVIALRTASGNPKVRWENAASQTLVLGDAKRQWQATAVRQGEQITAMAAEAERLREQGRKLQQLADAAQAKRAAALRKLSDMAATPGERADCQVLLKEAEEALDLAYKEGL